MFPFLQQTKKKKNSGKRPPPEPSKSSHSFRTGSEFLLHENTHFHILGATSNSENYFLFWEGVGPLFPKLHPLSYHVLSVSFQRTPGTSRSLCPKGKQLLSRSPTGFLVSHFSPSPQNPPLWMLWILCSFSNINELG